MRSCENIIARHTQIAAIAFFCYDNLLPNKVPGAVQSFIVTCNTRRPWQMRDARILSYRHHYFLSHSPTLMIAIAASLGDIPFGLEIMEYIRSSFFLEW